MSTNVITNLNLALKFVLSFTLILGIYECLTITLKIDAMAMVHRSTKVLNMYEILIESLCRNLRLVERNILSQMTKNKGKTNGDVLSVSMPEPFHFMPEKCGHFITRFYPKNSLECHLGYYQLLFGITRS